jgi:hypothetical protein
MDGSSSGFYPLSLLGAKRPEIESQYGENVLRLPYDRRVTFWATHNIGKRLASNDPATKRRLRHETILQNVLINVIKRVTPAIRPPSPSPPDRHQ